MAAERHWVKRETGKVLPGLVAIGLFFAGYGWLAWWYDLARNDTLFVFLCLATSYQLRYGGNWRWLWVGSAWVGCKLQQGIDGCHVGTRRSMSYGACGFNNNNLSVYSNERLSNDGWRLETPDALPRATRLVG